MFTPQGVKKWATWFEPSAEAEQTWMTKVLLGLLRLLHTLPKALNSSIESWRGENRALDWGIDLYPYLTSRVPVKLLGLQTIMVSTTLEGVYGAAENDVAPMFTSAIYAVKHFALGIGLTGAALGIFFFWNQGIGVDL